MTLDSRQVRVVERAEVADSVVALVLRAVDGGPLAAWEPGAHLDVVLPSRLVRQYSLCGRQDDASAYRIAVLREPHGRGGSMELVDQVQVGDELRVIGPRNRFALVDAPGYLFLAGGIGITPILPMIRSAQARSAPWRLVYGGRSRASMAFVAEVTSAVGGSVSILPQDESGLPDLPAELGALPDGHLVYCCGPGPMLDAVANACRERGLERRLHVERFAGSAGAASAAEPTAGPGTEAAEDRPMTVVLEESGLTLEVLPGRSILEVVQEAGVDVLFSCGEGDCGTCETDVLAGVPDHRDLVLTDAERASGRTMMICVSRAQGDSLTLAL